MGFTAHLLQRLVSIACANGTQARQESESLHLLPNGYSNNGRPCTAKKSVPESVAIDATNCSILQAV
jgi:hypothetical protein